MLYFKDSLLINKSFIHDNLHSSTYSVANFILKRLSNLTIYDLQQVIVISYITHLCVYKKRLFYSKICSNNKRYYVKEISEVFKNHTENQITTTANILIGDNEFYTPDIYGDDYGEEMSSILATIKFMLNKKSSSILIPLLNDCRDESLYLKFKELTTIIINHYIS